MQQVENGIWVSHLSLKYLGETVAVEEKTNESVDCWIIGITTKDGQKG